MIPLLCDGSNGETEWARLFTLKARSSGENRQVS
jgi:hypothetical protein